MSLAKLLLIALIKDPVLAIVSLNHYLNLNKNNTLKEDKKDKFINGTIKEGYLSYLLNKMR